jgi:predicted AlkP superfamily pyrophosphatase or phosphodiesterase
MRRLFRAFVLGATLLIAACASIAPAPSAPKSRLTILVSIDGFRSDYLDRGDTPTIAALAAGGARGPMRPSFPSLTYPNHYTLITGKRPDRNGVVNNTMEDADIPGVAFKMSNDAAVNDGRWWSQALPFWVSAEQQGRHAAAMFWPGSQAQIAGVRPSRWMTFDKAMTSNDRVDRLLSWLDDPKGPELRFSTLYFDVVDTEGHHFGPNSPELKVATIEVDQAIARLVDGLKARGRYETTDIIVVADHGMAAVPVTQRWMLDDILDVSKARVASTGAVVGVTPNPGQEAYVEGALLKAHPHLTCWRKADIPKRFHYGQNPRVPAIVCLSEKGWYVSTRAAKPGQWDNQDGGQHGFDPYDPDMLALFVAHGPSFRPGVTLPVFDNVDVYPLLARISGVKPEKGDGDLMVVGKALR